MASMNGRKAAAVLAAVAALLAVSVGAQSPAPGITAALVKPGILEAKPQTSVTVVFRVANGTKKSHTFTGRTALPGGWTLAMDDPAFKLAPGEASIRLLSVRVPGRAVAGSYRIGYAVAAKDDPNLAARADAEFRVLLEPRLTVQALDVQAYAIAGENTRTRFLVANPGNVALDIALDLRCDGAKVADAVRSLRLDPGESKPLDIVLPTDSGLRKMLTQNIEFRASSAVPSKGTITASATAQVDIIPSVYGSGEYYEKLPAEVGIMAMTANPGRTFAQFTLSGSGALDAAGRRKVDFFFRGPGRDEFYVFGLQREEYRLNYDSPAFGFSAGDKPYSLTRLTEFGKYARGGEARFDAGPVSVRGFYAWSLFPGENLKETAAQIGVAPLKNFSVRFNFLMRSDIARPTDRIVSLESQYASSALNLRLEYAADITAHRDVRPANTGLSLEANGGLKSLFYQVNIIRSGADYNGYFRNLDYNMGELTYAPWTRLQLRASYFDQKRNTAIEPFYSAFRDRTTQFGLTFQTASWLSLTADQRTHDRQDLSPESQFNFQDQSLRFGSLMAFGSVNIQAALDLGRTYNELTRAYESLAEYTISAGVLVLNKLTLSGYAHYRDQDAAFTGARIRSLDLDFSAGIQLGRTDISASYRTALHEQLYQSALSDESFKDPAFMLNNYDLFGLTATHRFGNGHILSLRVQDAVNPFAGNGPSSTFVGLVSYSIPIGIPVRAKTDVGRIRGLVYDAENGRKGVARVFVKANDLVTVTNGKGEFVFNSIEPGAYDVTVDARGAGPDKVTLAKAPFQIRVEGGQKIEYAIGLAAGSTISGRIMVYRFEKPEIAQFVRAGGQTRGPAASESGRGSLVEDAGLGWIGVEIRGGGEVFRQLTDRDGRFQFDGLRPGTYTLRVSEDDLPELHTFEKSSLEFEIKAGQKEEVLIKVLPVVREIQIVDQGDLTVRKKVVKKDA